MDRGPSKVSTRFMTTLFDDVMSRPPAVTIGGETKRKRKSGTKGSAFASIYKEDLGSTAVKSSYTNRVTTTTVPFKVPLTKKEKERRDERKVGRRVRALLVHVYLPNFNFD